jgi:WD40 repeat protein
MNTQQKQNPFKGLYSYEEEEGDKFYGRNQEAEELLKLAKLNMLTVVFGKSGIGKTSLIHAGLFPRLRNDYFLPIPVRLDYSHSSESLLTQVILKIQKELGSHHIRETEKDRGEQTVSFRGGETLWEYFHRVEHVDGEGKRWTPVLVLDQFEELFTIGRNHPDREALIEELYYLVEDQVPDFLRERFSDDGEMCPYIHTQAAVRMVLGLRENYLPHLNSLKQRIPSIDRMLFRVIHLNGRQAREVMEKTEGFGDERTWEDILRQFYPEDMKPGETVPAEKLEVEPSLLSLLCHQMFEKGITSLSGQEKDAILSDFYHKELRKLPRSKELAKFIETRLLTEGGFRTPLYLERGHPLRGAVEEAVNKKILRKMYYGEKEYVEIIHEVLVPVIKERRNRRREEERSQEIQKELRQKRRINRIIIIAGIVSLFLAVMFFVQKNRADMKHKEAVSNRLAAESALVLSIDNIKATRIAEAAYKISAPNPFPSVQQVLSTSAYSTYERPFYKVSMQYEDKILCATISTGGTKILTCSMDGVLKLWDLSGKLLADMDKHTDKVWSAIVSPDGNKIVTISDDNTAKLWDLSGKLSAELKHMDKVWSATFSPDGSKIITRSGNTAKLWTLKGYLLADLNKHTKYVSSAVFSPDGNKIVTASWDNTAKLWDLDGKLLTDLNKHTDYVWSADISPDGNKIITSSSDNTAKLWDLSGNLLAELKHTDKVWSAVFSPDGSKILTRYGNTAKIWDLKGNRLVDLNRHSNEVKSAVFSPDGTSVLTWSGNAVKLWDLKGKLLADFKHPDYVSSAIFSPDSTKILTCSRNTIRLWELSEQFLVDLNKYMDNFYNAAISPGGTKILTWSGSNAKLWDLKGNLIANLNKHKSYILDVGFSPDDSKILTASSDNTAKLWDLSGELLADLKEPRHNTAQLWDLSGNLLVKLDINMDDVERAVLSPDGSKMLTWSQLGNTAKLLDMKGTSLADLNEHTHSVTSAVFSPDGTKILTTSKDYTAKLWDLEGKLLVDLKKHTDSVSCAVFSPDGTKILTASDDSTAKLWDLKGNLLADLNKHTDDVLSAAFSPDGKHIFTVSKDGTVKRWYTPEAIIEWLKTAPIPKLSKEDKENLRITDFEVD